ncbi:HIT domain-containing protein [Candidatus Saccharibacteria bacterium]|nr:HIT domain-containing protein [Candidatus Saccharibacteria bacterium]
MPRTIFMDFIEGKAPCARVYEDDKTFAFLDQSPLTTGHTLVIPKDPVDQIDHCSEELYHAIFQSVHKVSAMLQKSLKPLRIALIVHGTEIPHAHVHVVPLYTGKELHLAAKDRERATSEDLSKLAAKICSA